MSHQTLHPEVLWAQRSSETDEEKNIVYLSVNAIDLQNPKVELRAEGVTVEGVQRETHNVYKASIDFYEDIDVEKSHYHATDRGVIFILRKSTKKLSYWPRLTKLAKKEHYIRTDFDKWVDEDEQDATDDPFANYNFGSGMPDMGDLDFSKLGGSMPKSSMDSSSDEEDEDMPDLTGDEPTDKTKESTEGKGKEPATS